MGALLGKVRVLLDVIDAAVHVAKAAREVDLQQSANKSEVS